MFKEVKETISKELKRIKKLKAWRSCLVKENINKEIEKESSRRERGTKRTGDLHRTNSKMAKVNPTILIIILNVV